MTFEHSALIIDDDVWMRRVLCKIILPEGFTCYHAANGYEGIAKASEYLPTLILLDIEMPELDGRQTLKILKQMDKVKDIPALVISGYLDSNLVSEMMRLGAANIVGKPFTAATVHEKLIQIFGDANLRRIQNQQQISNQTYSVADLENEFSFAEEEFDTKNFKSKHKNTNNELANLDNNKFDNNKENINPRNIPTKEAVRAYSDNISKNKNSIKEIIGDFSKK